jgi:hypothetical protein
VCVDWWLPKKVRKSQENLTDLKKTSVLSGFQQKSRSASHATKEFSPAERFCTRVGVCASFVPVKGLRSQEISSWLHEQNH